jgi:predicted 2-oxoglutarate/Fe(II)-dependent dioxygenase YbiX
VVLPAFLSRAACAQLIAAAEARGFQHAGDDYPASYRDNDRQVHDSVQESQALYAQLAKRAPGLLDRLATSPSYRPESLNPRLRYCRYRAGQQFRIHRDGVWHVDDARASQLTFLLYLTDADAKTGGDTLFYAGPPTAAGAPKVVARIRPEAGTLVLFDHRLWHAGAPIRSGSKYVLRSDGLYKRSVRPPEAPQAEAAHRGYVWSLLSLSDGGFASAGRDASVRLWSSAGEPLRLLSGHRQSVLGLALLDAQRLVSVSRDRSLKVWCADTGRMLHDVPAHGSAVLSVCALGPTGIVTGAADGSIVHWSPALTRCRAFDARAWVWSLCALDPRTFASAGEDGTARLWRLEAQVPVAEIPGEAPLRAVAYAPARALLVTGDARGSLRMWSQPLGERRLVWELPAHNGAVRSLRFVDAHSLLSTGEDGKVLCHELGACEWTTRLLHTYADFATDAIALDAGRVASASYDGRVLVHAR